MYGSKRDAVIDPEIHLLGPGAAPQPLDERSPRHAPLPSMLIAMPLDQQAGERGTRGPRALVRVAALRLAVPRQRLLQCLDAE